ncbi:MAG: hypothetical protein IT215_00545 [Chitinophagaceae bacterium]|nr:hypothetical protein [Chitinophagaceae bacterium]
MTAKKTFYTPSEVVEKIPMLKRIGWTPQRIGTLLSLKLIKGDSIRSKKISRLDKDSLLRLLKIRNEIVGEEIIKV